MMRPVARAWSATSAREGAAHRRAPARSREDAAHRPGGDIVMVARGPMQGSRLEQSGQAARGLRGVDANNVGSFAGGSIGVTHRVGSSPGAARELLGI